MFVLGLDCSCVREPGGKLGSIVRCLLLAAVLRQVFLPGSINCCFFSASHSWMQIGWSGKVNGPGLLP